MTQSSLIATAHAELSSPTQFPCLSASTASSPQPASCPALTNSYPTLTKNASFATLKTARVAGSTASPRTQSAASASLGTSLSINTHAQMSVRRDMEGTRPQDGARNAIPISTRSLRSTLVLIAKTRSITVLSVMLILWMKGLLSLVSPVNQGFIQIRPIVWLQIVLQGRLGRWRMT